MNHQPPPAEFINTLASYRSLVWPVIEKYLNELKVLPSYCRIPSRYQNIINYHYQMVSDYPKRQGKYLRPSLVLLTAGAMGLSPNDVLTTAAAMQISEEWILVHDDVEDNSLERRGQPTLHRSYGSELAINAGDALHVVMWRAIFDATREHPNHSLALFNEFYQLLNRTTLGQTIDIKWTQDNVLDLSQEDIFLILESKTCYYTISGPMRLGAILAGATKEQLNHLYRFGLYLGRAFQIVDDLLDLTSNFSGQKQQYNDIYEGKRTVLLSHLWRQASPADQKRILSIMSKPRLNKTSSDISTIINLMEKYGTFSYTRLLAKKLGKQSQSYLTKYLSFLNCQPYRSQLEQGIEFVINRNH